jgi:GNAT superfamily N-acetyltransferase
VPQAFTIRALTPDAIPQALPLLRATWPGVELPGWSRFVDAFRGDLYAQAEITAMFDPQGSLCGLFAARVEHDFRDGRTLALPLFTAVDVGNSLAPVKALLEAAEAMARDRGCSGLEIRLDTQQRALIERLRFLELRLSGSLHSATIATAPH